MWLDCRISSTGNFPQFSPRHKVALLQGVIVSHKMQSVCVCLCVLFAICIKILTLFVQIIIIIIIVVNGDVI